MAKKSDLKFDFEDYGMTFFARDLHRLRIVISEQSDDIFDEAGASIPSHCASLILILDDYDEAPVMKLAAALGYSHQLLNQRIKILEKNGCVRKHLDPNDRRRTLVSLTKHGRSEAAKVRNALPIIDAGIRNAVLKHNADIQQTVKNVRLALLASSLSDRARGRRPSARQGKRQAGR